MISEQMMRPRTTVFPTTLSNRLILGLIDGLEDEDWMIRVLAIENINALYPSSHSAFSALIKRLDDENEAVRDAALKSLSKFGSLAEHAGGKLEFWLNDVNEHRRLQAAIVISSINNDHHNGLRVIRECMQSCDPFARSTANNFSFRTTRLRLSEAILRGAIREAWSYSASGQNIDWRSNYSDGLWNIDVAPILQEICSGTDRGTWIWADFTFDLNSFSERNGISLSGTWSQRHLHGEICDSYDVIAGAFSGQPFVLRVHREPAFFSKPQEFVNPDVGEVTHVLKDGAAVGYGWFNGRTSTFSPFVDYNNHGPLS